MPSLRAWSDEPVAVFVWDYELDSSHAVPCPSFMCVCILHINGAIVNGRELGLSTHDLRQQSLSLPLQGEDVGAYVLQEGGAAAACRSSG